jgi:uncharacterized protein (TIGR04442 family)
MTTTTFEQTRQALASYFMFATADGSDVPDSTIIATLRARKDALTANNQRFEQLLLDIGKYCDERLDMNTLAGQTGRKNFHHLIDVVHRMEEASQRINKMVFFARGIPDNETLAICIECWHELNLLKPGLFKELLLDDLFSNNLIGRMGRKRLKSLLEGLETASLVGNSPDSLRSRMVRVEQEEQLLVSIVTSIQEAIGTRHGLLAGDGEREVIKRLVAIELRHKRILNGEIPENLFDVGLRLAKSSLMYMNTLLPIIARQGDSALREEFIRDSGLDRLLVEELEDAWCLREQISPATLTPLRSQP